MTATNPTLLDTITAGDPISEAFIAAYAALIAAEANLALVNEELAAMRRANGRARLALEQATGVLG